MPQRQESDPPFPWFQCHSHWLYGGQGGGGRVTGNQTLVEQGCWVVRATFSSLITGGLLLSLGARLLPIGWSSLWP